MSKYVIFMLGVISVGIGIALSQKKGRENMPASLTKERPKFFGFTAEEKYSEYFNPYNLKILKESIAQAERGETITFSVAELEAMENGVLPQRAIDFLEKHNGENR